MGRLYRVPLRPACTEGIAAHFPAARKIFWLFGRPCDLTPCGDNSHRTDSCLLVPCCRLAVSPPRWNKELILFSGCGFFERGPLLFWVRELDSNQQPPAYEAGELPLLYPVSLGYVYIIVIFCQFVHHRIKNFLAVICTKSGCPLGTRFVCLVIALNRLERFSPH